MFHFDRHEENNSATGAFSHIIDAGEVTYMNLRIFAACSLALVLAFSADAFSQGKGRGNGGGNGKGNSGQPKGNSKHDDDSWDRDGDKGNGKSKKADGLSGSDNRFKGLSKKLGRSPESLKAWYEAERAVNPNLNYGQFVAANMVARNHNIAPETILRGLRRGQSIGQTLKRSGWDDDRIKEERRRLKKMGDDGWGDYVDRAIDWGN